MIITSVVGLTGVCMTLVMNFYVFNVGRLLYGIAGGAQGVIGVRMLVELMPNDKLSTCIAIYGTS